MVHPNMFVFEKPKNAEVDNKFLARVIDKNNMETQVIFSFRGAFCRVLDLIRSGKTLGECSMKGIWLASNIFPLYGFDFLIDLRIVKENNTDVINTSYSRLYKIFNRLSRYSNEDGSIHLRKVTNLESKNFNSKYRILVLRDLKDDRLLTVICSNLITEFRNILRNADINVSLNNRGEIWAFEDMSGRFDYVVDVMPQNQPVQNQEPENLNSVSVASEAVPAKNPLEVPRKEKISKESENPRVQYIQNQKPANLSPPTAVTNKTVQEESTEMSKVPGNEEVLNHLDNPPSEIPQYQKPEHSSPSTSTKDISKVPEQNESSKKQEDNQPTQNQNQNLIAPKIIAICMTCGGVVRNHFMCFHCNRIFLENPTNQTTNEPLYKSVCMKLEI